MDKVEFNAELFPTMRPLTKQDANVEETDAE